MENSHSEGLVITASVEVCREFGSAYETLLCVLQCSNMNKLL